jgi:hypothetical protein
MKNETERRRQEEEVYSTVLTYFPFRKDHLSLQLALPEIHDIGRNSAGILCTRKLKFTDS